MTELVKETFVYSTAGFAILGMGSVLSYLYLICKAENGTSKIGARIFAAIVSAAVLMGIYGYAVIWGHLAQTAPGEAISEEAKNVKISYKKENSQENLIEFQSASQNKTMQAWATVKIGETEFPKITYKKVGNQIAEAQLLLPALDIGMVSQKIEEPEGKGFGAGIKLIYWLYLVASLLTSLLTGMIACSNASGERESARETARREARENEGTALFMTDSMMESDGKERQTEETPEYLKKRVVRV